MSETVDVTVKLPVPEVDKQWSIKLSGGPFIYRAEFEQAPIVSATVMVEMTRKTAGFIVGRYYGGGGEMGEIAEEIRAAFARKDADRKPCPVMVCHYGGDRDRPSRQCTDLSGMQHPRRPCKLAEGHEKDGSAHE